MTTDQLATFAEIDREAHEFARGLARLIERLERVTIVHVPMSFEGATYEIRKADNDSQV